MTSGQETEQVYSYNPGAYTGHLGLWLLLPFLKAELMIHTANKQQIIPFVLSRKWAGFDLCSHCNLLIFSSISRLFK